MQRISAIFVVTGLATLLSGCGKSPPQQQKTASHQEVRSDALDEQAIKLRGRRGLDEVQEEAQAAMHQVRSRVKTTAQKHADELSAFAAEMIEDAKDRAEDIPEAIDRALDRHTRRWRDGRSKRTTASDSDG